jgi:hypothetical protein
MSNLRHINDEIRHLEEKQKKGIPNNERRHVVGELTDRIVEYNDALRAKKQADERGRAMDRNREEAKDFFNHTTGRRVFGPG